MLSRAIKFAPVLDTPPSTPVLRHFTGDPDNSPEVLGTIQNMTNNATLKLPEFWEHAAAPWFAHAESQFAIRGIADVTIPPCRRVFERLHGFESSQLHHCSAATKEIRRVESTLAQDF